MESHIGNIMTLSNSIIGVSILAMPFCFKQCGIILAILMLLINSIVSRLTCHFLLKSAIMARRRTFELLAFHAFGTTGKIIVELGIIGFLMGTCIAFFVIIGDLGPAIIAKMTGSTPTDTLRTSILIGVALFCALPLGLLKNIDSLHSVCTATIGFYFCLVLKTISESASHFVSGSWLINVELWRPAGVLQCLPIFAMALSCQTQLFEIYEIVVNPTLDKMNYIVRVAINICVAVYMCVGFFGYAAFASEPFSGNILMSFSQSPVTDVMKIGFVLSVAFSFPLVIFPCRASLYSLLFKKGYTPYEGASNYIPETKFKLLTVIIVATSLSIGILIPNIEVVLGLLGSTIGTMICMIFPVTCFICISTKNTNERLVAQILLFVGVIVMVLGTYANLYAMEQINDPIMKDKESKIEMKNDLLKAIEADKILEQVNMIPEIRNEVKKNEIPIVIKNTPQEIRLEPPQPVEPEEPEKNIKTQQEIIDKQKKSDLIVKSDVERNIKIKTKNLAEFETKKADEVDIEAIKKEDNELREEEKNKQKEDDKDRADLMKTLEQHKEEQKKLIIEQKELIKELKQTQEELKEKQQMEIDVEVEVRRKAASQILEIAKKAIEKLAPEAINKNEKDQMNKVLTNSHNKSALKLNKTSPIIKSDDLSSIKLLPNDRLMPFPMAVNKTLNEILYNKTNIKKQNISNETPKIFENIVEPNVKNNSQFILNAKTISQIINDGNKKTVSVENFITNSDKNIGKNEVKLENINVEKPDKMQEIEVKKLEVKVSNENMNPAKRDILANIENTEKTIRVKREAGVQLDQNNEKCEQNKNKLVKTESPLIKSMTETSKTNQFKLASNILMESMKSQLKPEFSRFKRK